MKTKALHKIAIYNTFTDDLIVIIKTNFSCEDLDNYKNAAYIAECLYTYGIFCSTDFYGEYTKKDTDIIIK